MIHGCLGYEHYLVRVSYKSQLNYLLLSNRTVSSKTKLHLDGSNFFDNNVNTVSLARTYWGIPSSSFEIGGNTTLPRSAYGLRGSGVVLTPNLSGLRQYSPIRPRQTHSITPVQ